MGWTLYVLGCLAAAPAAEGAGAPPAAKPPWQRLLQGDDAKKAAELEKRVAALQEAAKFEEALKVAQELEPLRRRGQGADHWQAVNSRWQAEALRRVLSAPQAVRRDYAAALPLQRQAEALGTKGHYRQAQPLLEKVLQVRRQALGEQHPHTATGYNELAANLQAQGRYREAEDGFRKALAIRRKVLGEDHPDTAQGYNNVAASLNAQGRYKEAEEGFRKNLAICRKVLGEEHPSTAAGYNNVAASLHAQGRYKEAEEGYRKALAIRRKALGEEHPDTALSYNNVAYNLNAQGRYAQAQPLYEKALAIFRKVLGEEHPDTATGYNNVAFNLNAQGRYKEAEEGYRKALAIRRKVLGEQHPHTAHSYNNVAYSLNAQGRYGEAEEGYRKALAIWRKALGEAHPDTAQGYTGVADNLYAQGRYGEAEEGFRKALAIRRKALGEEHPHTAQSYNNLATIPNAQGRYREAEEWLRRALAICRKALGEQHPDTATGYGNVASNLDAQGRYKEAEEGHRKALAIFRKALGEQHPVTAQSYNNLAGNLSAQGRHHEAEEGFRRALAVWRQALGEEHPLTAIGHNNVAGNLNAQGRYGEAEEGYRKALAIWRKALGEGHPFTATTYSSLAGNLHSQGRYQEAESTLLRAAGSFATARLRLAASGLGRATKTGEGSPLPALAAVLARNGKAADAWRCYEERLGRGTWDDLSARLRRPAAEQARQAELVAALDRLDQLLENSLAVKDPTAAQQRRRQELLTRQRQAQDDLNTFAHSLEEKYGPAAGQIFDLPRIQAALPADAALLGWIDIAPTGPKAADPNGEHWAFLLRHAGPPTCVRLRGSGTDGAWAADDTSLPARLRDALQSPRGDWKALAQRLRQQRLGPLAKQLVAHDGLPAVHRLIVLPSPGLAGVPAEIFTDGYTVSYALSGTLYTHLRRQPAPATVGLFALADPVFEAPAVPQKEQPLPPGGVLLTVVVPGGNAAQSGLRPNDVLLRYAGQELKNPADLKTMLQAKVPDQPVPVTAWRNGKTFDAQVQPGKLGVVLAEQPAPQALAELRRLDRALASRGDSWAPLPGTRAEARSLVRLFGEGPTTKLLLGSEASQQQLHELARTGELGRYRYVHLATHGDVDDTLPLRSAVILSRDRLPDALRQLQAGLPVFDGRLTARQVLEQWHLDADLVTLSACQTALGKYERGEGFVGFAQALILAGSRSVCLSLWKVDDTATALLMQRFYANLLGKRDGLQAPLPRAVALREAKEWLRGLSRDEASRVAAALSQGVERGKGRKRLPPLPEAPAAAKEDRPYAHPYYWAAFVLLGDPE
jgi:tetratricopeptide (TPR) repeat protein